MRWPTQRSAVTASTYTISNVQCQDRQTGEGTRLRQWRVVTLGAGECLDISEENEFNSLKIKTYKERKEPMKCTKWLGGRCPEGGRKNFTETVKCVKRDEVYTGHYAFRSGFTDVPTYETVTQTPFYKDIIKINVFGEEQSSKFSDKSVSVRRAFGIMTEFGCQTCLTAWACYRNILLILLAPSIINRLLFQKAN